MTTNVQLQNIIMIILNTLRHKSTSRPTSTDSVYINDTPAPCFVLITACRLSHTR